MIKNLIKYGLKKLGVWDQISARYYQIISKSAKPLTFEETFKLRKNFYSQFVSQGDLVFDVGANVGNRVEIFLSLGCKVVAIEPQQECIDALKEKFGPLIDIEECALGENMGTQTMHICQESVFSSFSTEWINSVKEGRFSNLDRDWDEKREIRLKTLDLLIKDYSTPQFIKIDVEGYELSVLKGLSKKIQYISFEYTIPEQKDQIYKCLEFISSIFTIRVNYSKAESMMFELDRWYSHEEFNFILDSPNFNQCPFGDIYVKAAQFQS